MFVPLTPGSSGSQSFDGTSKPEDDKIVESSMTNGVKFLKYETKKEKNKSCGCNVWWS